MKHYKGKGLLIAGIAFLTVPSALLAQDKQDQNKETTTDRQQIVINRKADKGEKTVIEIDGDKVKINGKDPADVKDVTVSINKNVRMNRFRVAPDGQQGNTIWYNNGGNIDLLSEDANRAMLGVVTDDNDKGAEIESVNKESAAEKAGLKKGDVITAIDGKKVEGPDDVTKMVRAHKPGDKINITLLRDGKEQKLTAELGKWKGIHMNMMAMPKMNYDFNVTPDTPNPPGDFAFPRNFSYAYGGEPRLGLSIQDQEDGPGVKVLDVDDESAAEKAGIKEDDVIVGINDHEIKNTDDAKRIIREEKDKGSYVFKINRDGKVQNITVKIPKKLKTTDL